MNSLFIFMNGLFVFMNGLFIFANRLFFVPLHQRFRAIVAWIKKTTA